MILAHTELSAPIVLDIAKPAVLIIEQAALFRRWVQCLTFQCEGEAGDFVLSHSNEDRCLSRHALLIRDPLFATEIEEQIGKVLLKCLERLARDEYVAETQKIECALLEYAEMLSEGLHIALESAAEIDIRALVKLLRIVPAWEDDLLPRLCSQMRLAQDFLGTELFIFVGVKAYLNTDELMALYQEFEMHQMRVLLIEPYQSEILPVEQTVIIDRDLCELRLPQRE